LPCSTPLPGEVILRFPQSAVLYLEKNDHIPDFLRCRLIFQDGHEHIYQIPAIKIQAYSLQSILEKHLDLFLPYVLLRLRLKPKTKHPLTKDELTDFARQVILVLRKELDDGYLSEQQFNDYMIFFQAAAKRVLRHYPDYYEEVESMTKPLIELPSVRERRLLAERDAELAEKNAELAELAEKNAALAEKDAVLADWINKATALEAELKQFKTLLKQKTENNIKIM